MGVLRLLGRPGVWPITAFLATFAGLAVAGVVPPLVAVAGAAAGSALSALRWLLSAVEPPASDPDEQRSAADVKVDWPSLLSALPDAAVLLDSSGMVLAANAAARGMFTSLADGVHVSSLSRSPDFLELFAQPRQRPQSASIEERVPVERRILATAVSLPQPVLAGAPFWLVTLRDLTESHKLDQMRVDFVANASHELRTPLASLLGFIETLRGSARDDARARERFLAIMATEGGRMKRLIDDLLSLSRIEMRQHVRPTARVDLADVLLQVVASVEPQAEEAKVSVALDLPDGQFVTLGDHDELVQLFANLLHNAVKYGRSGGVAKVSARWRDARMIEDHRCRSRSGDRRAASAAADRTVLSH